MEKRNVILGRDRMIAVGSMLLCAGAITFAVITGRENDGLRVKLDEQRKDRVQLLDKGSQLRNDLLFKEQRIASLVNEEQALRDRLAQEERARKEAERRADQARAQVRNSGVPQKEHDALKAEKLRLEQQLVSANTRLQELAADLARSRDEKDKLAQELAQAQEIQATMNNSLVEAKRGKKREKLVVKARRTQHLNVDLELPEAVAKQVRMKITGPKGKTFEVNDPVITASTTTDDQATASLNAGAAVRPKMARVSMKVDAKEKLVPGTYKIDVYAGNKYLGTTRKTLR